jgi:UDP-N-acetylmuramate dehydrogenase
VTDCGFAYRWSRFKAEPERWAVLSVQYRLSYDVQSRPVRYAELARVLGIDVGGQAPVAEVQAAVLSLRKAKGMVLDDDDPDTRSVGSFFTNPLLDAGRVAELRSRGGDPPAYPEPDGRVKVSAAWLIEQAGFGKGWGDGRVGISSRHTLALVNRGGGTTAELLDLARLIRAGVHDRFGVMLSPEPVFVGASL